MHDARKPTLDSKPFREAAKRVLQPRHSRREGSGCDQGGLAFHHGKIIRACDFSEHKNKCFVNSPSSSERLIIPRQSIRSFEGSPTALVKYLGRIEKEHEAIISRDWAPHSAGKGPEEACAGISEESRESCTRN